MGQIFFFNLHLCQISFKSMIHTSVCIIGGQSQGSSTLAKSLSSHNRRGMKVERLIKFFSTNGEGATVQQVNYWFAGGEREREFYCRGLMVWYIFGGADLRQTCTRYCLADCTSHEIQSLRPILRRGTRRRY